MKRNLVILLILVSLAGCGPKTPIRDDWMEWERSWSTWEGVDAPEISRLVAIFSAKMKHEERLDLENSFAIIEDGFIQKMYLEYSTQRLLTLSETRLLMVTIVDGFLDLLNRHTELSFQLSHFPFTSADLDVTLNFESYFGLYVDPLYMGRVYLRNGCVYYYAFDIKNINADWWHQKTEPYLKSREFALFKQMAEMPYTEQILNPPLKAGERYYDITP